MAIRIICAMLFSLAFNGLVLADSVALNPSHPDRYTVVKGDTLWDISAMFLRDPWRWPQIWRKNPQIKNPDLIYPGDVLVLTWVDGQPRITMYRDGGKARLEPRIREEDIEDAIPAIPISAIRQFLSSPRVVSEKELLNAPYIVAFAGEHLAGGAGQNIYVESIEEHSTDRYTVFRPGQTFKDGDTGELLGHEAIYVGDTNLLRTGSPATLQLTRTAGVTLEGDRLLPIQEERIRLNYYPRPPDTYIRGHIIGVLEGVAQIGQYNIVALDRGTADGVEAGHVFEILQSGQRVRDTARGSIFPERDITLPDERAGVLMVFRPFERVSYALVMRATGAIHVMDLVQTPQ